jgi:RNA 3'-terminal phosphate cyclase (ATP)
MIEIDGSQQEGGGQIIRTALALSAITKKPVHIFNIRAKRPNPGLQPQHLTAVKAVRNICRGTLEGAELNSKELTFHPGDIVGGRYEFNIGTAGSVTLVAQTLIPILLYAEKKSELKIIGGTHVTKSPSYDYFEKVFLPAIRLMNADVSASLIRTGYYPRGGGEINVSIAQSKLKGNKEWPQERKTHVLIRLSNLPLHIGIREKKVFVQHGIEDIKIIEEKAYDQANALLVWRGFNGVDVLGEKGKRAETVAEEALAQLNEECADVDRHLADQLLLYAALADAETTFRTSVISEHLKTNIAIISKFVERKIEIVDNSVRVY